MSRVRGGCDTGAMSNDVEHAGRVDPVDLLLRTDWNAVEHCCPDVAPETPVILRELLDDDPRVQGYALRCLAEALIRGNVFYTATAPAARYVAAVLGDPRTLAQVTDRSAYEVPESGPQTPFPLRAGLMNWLGDAVVDAISQQGRPYGDEEDLDAFLELAPEFYEAVHPFLTSDSPAYARRPSARSCRCSGCPPWPTGAPPTATGSSARPSAPDRTAGVPSTRSPPGERTSRLCSDRPRPQRRCLHG